VPWHAMWLRALQARKWTTRSNLSSWSVLDAEQVTLDECGSWFRLQLFESLMERRFLSSCTNVSRM
jgi:hypothetical protein